jgi:hypothetical protein
MLLIYGVLLNVGGLLLIFSGAFWYCTFTPNTKPNATILCDFQRFATGGLNALKFQLSTELHPLPRIKGSSCGTFNGYCPQGLPPNRAIISVVSLSSAN